MESEKTVMSGCSQDCGGRCVLKYYVKDGKITRIETDDGEEPQLRACLRGRAYRQKVYAKERLLYPMKRVGKRGEGKFERISWDEAMEKVGSEIKRVKATYGPAAIYLLSGTGHGSTVLHHGNGLERALRLFGGHTERWGSPSAHGAVFATRANGAEGG